MCKRITIKDRRVFKYFDTIDRKKWWVKQAEKWASFSQFVLRCVEYAIEQRGPDITEVGEGGLS